MTYEDVFTTVHEAVSASVSPLTGSAADERNLRQRHRHRNIGQIGRLEGAKEMACECIQSSSDCDVSNSRCGKPCHQCDCYKRSGGDRCVYYS